MSWNNRSALGGFAHIAGEEAQQEERVCELALKSRGPVWPRIQPPAEEFGPTVRTFHVST